MAAVGSVTCTFVRGVSPSLRSRVDTWQLPGIDGYGVQLLGRGDTEWMFEAVLYDDEGDVSTWYTQLEALQGTIVTVVDDWGDSYTNILLVRVSQLDKTIAVPNGARGEVRIEAKKVN